MQGNSSDYRMKLVKYVRSVGRDRCDILVSLLPEYLESSESVADIDNG